jgi:hypothetical protein
MVLGGHMACDALLQKILLLHDVLSVKNPLNMEFRRVLSSIIGKRG